MSLPSDEEILNSGTGESYFEGAVWMRSLALDFIDSERSLAENEIAKLRTEAEILTKYFQTRVDIEKELLERIGYLESLLPNATRS